MQKGNYGDTVQAFERERIGEHAEEQAKAQGGEYAENRELIRIAQSNTEDAQTAAERLLIINRGLVRSIAIRFRDRGLELDDLMQIGTIGLLKAVRSFDLERGTCFSTYAVPMIFGEIRRSLRDEGPIKVGRYYKKIGIQLMRAKNKISEEEGTEPTISRIAAEVGISVEEASVALDAMAPISSLSDYVYGDEEGRVLEDMIADADSLDQTERIIDRMTLWRAIGKMPEQWQKILIMRYFRNMTQQQVANMLGLSQVKVSREEKKIVEFLRNDIIR